MSNSDFYEIHTSDRILFKRCRRKWSLRSPLRAHLVSSVEPNNIHLWFGTGFHFALEDFHGYNKFGDPVLALEAYYKAFSPEELPQDAEETIALGIGMLEHYRHWLTHRDEFKTWWRDGVPVVEVRFALELTEFNLDKPVIYRGTIDRVVVDDEGRYWIQDYKTAAKIDTNKLANDPQVGAYVWAAEQYFGIEIEGILYTQFAKNAPSPPKILKNGSISLDKRQYTTHYLYRQELLKKFPNGRFSADYIEFLNELAAQETVEGDRFIRTDRLYRNQASKETTYRHIMMEVGEMLNPDLPIYPNQTRDCSWECSDFRTVCIAMDEGDDWEYMLENFYEKKKEEDETWRKRIQWPNQ